MTKTLFKPILCEQEFGRKAVRVDALLAWAGQLPNTQPDIAQFEVVQIEALITAINHGVDALLRSGDDAAVCDAALQLEHLHPTERKIIEEGTRTTAAFVLKQHASGAWRSKIRKALATGQLVAIDSLTMLPTDEPSGGAREPTRREFPSELSMSTDEICSLFDGLRWSQTEWEKAINKNRPAWLLACRRTKGTQGNNSTQATWDPIAIARALLVGDGRLPVVPRDVMSRRFRAQRALTVSAAWESFIEDNPLLG